MVNQSTTLSFIFSDIGGSDGGGGRGCDLSLVLSDDKDKNDENDDSDDYEAIVCLPP